MTAKERAERYALWYDMTLVGGELHRDIAIQKLADEFSEVEKLATEAAQGFGR